MLETQTNFTLILPADFSFCGATKTGEGLLVRFLLWQWISTVIKFRFGPQEAELHWR